MVNKETKMNSDDINRMLLTETTTIGEVIDFLQSLADGYGDTNIKLYEGGDNRIVELEVAFGDDTIFVDTQTTPYED